MATDFNKFIGTSGAIRPTTADTPADIRTRIETIAEVESIPLPFVGMIFYVIDEEKFYKVTSLKGKQVGPIFKEDMIVDRFEVLIPEQEEVDLTHLATKEEVQARFEELVGAAPEAMNTLQELAEAIEGHQGVYDAYVAQVSTALEGKAAKEEVEEIRAEMEGFQRKAPVFCGYLPASLEVKDYSQITLDMIRHEEAVIRECKLEGKINIGEGLVPSGCAMVVAIPVLMGRDVKKDDGFGGQVEFSEEVCGANGVIVELDGVDYRLFGEVTLEVFECLAHVVRHEEPKQDLSHLATKEEVEEAIAAIEHPQFDDSHLATKEEAEACHAELRQMIEDEIARAQAREDEIAAEIDDEEPYMADLAAYKTSKFLFACGHPVYVQGKEDGTVEVSYKWSDQGMKSIVLSAEDAAKTYIVGGYGHDNHNSKRSLPMTKIVARDAKIKGIVGGHYFEGIVGHAVIDAENCQMSSLIAGGWCGANVDGRTTRLNIVHETDVRLVNVTVSSTLYGGPQGNGVVDDSFMTLKDVKAGWVTVGGSNGLTNKGQIEIDGETEIEVLQTTNRGLVRHAEVVMNDGHVKQFFVGGETEDKTVTGGIEHVEVQLINGSIDKLRMGTSEGQPFAGQVKGAIFRCEVKETEVDMAQFEVVEEPVVVEYAEKDHEHEQYLTEHQDISHLASKEDMEAVHTDMESRMDEKIAALAETTPQVMKSLEDLAGAIEAHEDVYEAYVAQVGEALDGKAALDHEHDQYLTEHQPIDHLATKEQCQAAHEDLEARLEAEIARAMAREDEIAAEIDDEEPYMADLKAYPTSKFLFACGHPVRVEGQEDGSVMVSYKWAGELKGILLSPEDAAKTYIIGGYGDDNHNSKRSLPMTKVVARDAKIKGIVGGHYFEGIVGHAVIDAENCQMTSVMAGGWCGASVDGRQTRLNIVHEADVRLVNSSVSSTLFGGSQGNGCVDSLHMVLDGVKAGWVTVGGSNGLTNEGFVEIKGDSEITVFQTTNRGLVRRAEVEMQDGLVHQFFIGGETEDKSVDGIVDEVEVRFIGGTVERLRKGTSKGEEFAGAFKGSMLRAEVKESDVELEQIVEEVQPVFAEQAMVEEIRAEVVAMVEAEAARAMAREDEIAAEIDDEEPYIADLAAYKTSRFLFACGHPVYVQGQEDGSVVVSYKWTDEGMKSILLSPEDAPKTYIVGGYGHDNHNSKRSLARTKVVARDAKIKGIVGGHYFEGIVGESFIDAKNCQMTSVIVGGWCGANVDGRTTRLNIVHEAKAQFVDCSISSTLYGGPQGNGCVDHVDMVLDNVKAGWVTVGGSNGLTNGGRVEIDGETEIEVLQTTNRGLVRHAEVVMNDGHVKQFFVGGETEDKSVTGAIEEVEVHLMGGVVDKFRLGTSEGQPFAGAVKGSMFQCEVKESEVDMAQFEVVEEPVVVEYAEKDHEHEQYAMIDHTHDYAALDHAHADIEERVQVLETINLESKPYIAKDGMLVLCGCPAVARGVGEEVHVSVRFFNNKEDKFVFTKDEFAKLRICMGYGAEGIGTKRGVIETTLELYDIDRVWIIDGGSQVTGEIGTVNIIAERCGYIDGIQGARAMNGGERNIVHNFNVHVKDCGLIDTLFGGGNGFSVVWNNNVVIEGETEINTVIVGGSNGYTNAGNVVVKGGHVHLMHAVNRGIVNRAVMTVEGGQVDEMFICGDPSMADAGVAHHSEVKLMGGQVGKLEVGANAEQVAGCVVEGVVVEGDTSMLEQVQQPVDEVAELKAQVAALMARLDALEK